MNKYALFHKGLLRQYQVVTDPGTYEVNVAYTVRADNIYVEDDYPRHLIPLKVITLGNLTELMEILNSHSDDSLHFSKVRHFFMTGAIFDDNLVDEETLPIKGERVLATFDMKDGELMCTHVELLPRVTLDFIDPDKYDTFKQALANCLGL